MKRVFNFAAGPSMLPLPVLERAAREMTDQGGSGQSVMEMSHRSKEYKVIIEGAEALLRELMGIPDSYSVLFLQGGATAQFAMVPINLAYQQEGQARRTVTYVDTGVWASKAAEEAAKYADVRVAASSKDRAYSYIPAVPAPMAQDAYYHITLNNTIVGTKWPSIPDTGTIPLVADISSCILSERLDVGRFDLLYAGAQKNLGPAGVTVVILRKDLIQQVPDWVPIMFRYDIQAENGSMYNTPPCYGIYIIKLVLEWMKDQGGLGVVEARNHEKAALLYDYLDNSSFFRAPVEKGSRSLMNVPFVIRGEGRKELEDRFVKEAVAAGLVNLAGHRLVGGMRASIYNAMPIEGVRALIDFMKKFEGANGR